ncbi:MAG: hypothetical protein SGJ00_02450 [bacterium]|nr:hypothetical protein [bacterium]
MTTSGGNVTAYYYDAQNRVIRTASFVTGQTDSVISTFEYLGNTVVNSANNGLFDLVQTSYLNAHGFADSMKMSFGTFGDIMLRRKFDSEYRVIEQTLIGDVAGTEIDQVITHEYNGGNMLLQTNVDNVAEKTEVISYQYYLDKVNKAKAFEEKTNLVNSNTNLLKRKLSNLNTSVDYTYQLDADGNILKMTMLDEQSAETWNTYSWNCK